MRLVLRVTLHIHRCNVHISRLVVIGRHHFIHFGFFLGPRRDLFILSTFPSVHLIFILVLSVLVHLAGHILLGAGLHLSRRLFIILCHFLVVRFLLLLLLLTHI